MRSSRRIGVVLVLLLGTVVRGQEAVLTWRGVDRPLGEIADAAAPAAAAVRAWLPFAQKRAYRFVLADDQRTLLVLCPAYARRGKKEHHDVEVMVGLARDALAVVDRFAAPASTPLVVAGVRTADYAGLLEHVAGLDPRLRTWADGAGQAVAGFILSEPLVAAWVDDPAGVDEWHPYNELVHRAAQLAVRSRAPQLPDWLLTGIGWHVEDTVLDSVYCFPHRRGFVSAAEHTDWGLVLANNFKASRRKQAGRPPTLAATEFLDWVAGAGDDEFASGRAYIAFGVARFLAQEHAERLQPLLAQFAEAIEKGSKVWISDHEWKTLPDYRIPTHEQLAALELVEPGFLGAVTQYFQKKKANERKPPGKRR